MKLEVYKIEQSATLPTRATEQASCYDLHACLHGDISVYYKGGKGVKSIQTDDDGQKSIVLRPRERVAVPTGLILNIPEGYDVKLYARSGLSLKNGISLSNSVGVIDADYKDELFVTVINNSDDVYIIKNDMRIAQLELTKKSLFDVVEISDKPQATTDRKGGLGSTGVEVTVEATDEVTTTPKRKTTTKTTKG